ncbi:MliC family protein [Roseovarius aquimarinus]|uniref:MliC family protein n=1 Tax=Roseovarius aquimarinus TaxID=1229156 RepID=A0ABW7I5J9_9RHOB
MTTFKQPAARIARHIAPRIALGAALTFAGAAASAQTGLMLPLELGPDGEVNSVAYTCDDGTKLKVQYVNAGRNALALIPLKGETVVFAGVVSGSGARYVSGANVWWSKGDGAELTDETGDAQPVSCTSGAE